jgi:hypothetical protein
VVSCGNGTASVSVVGYPSQTFAALSLADAGAAASGGAVTLVGP